PSRLSLTRCASSPTLLKSRPTTANRACNYISCCSYEDSLDDRGERFAHGYRLPQKGVAPGRKGESMRRLGARPRWVLAALAAALLVGCQTGRYWQQSASANKPGATTLAVARAEAPVDGGVIQASATVPADGASRAIDASTAKSGCSA